MKDTIIINGKELDWLEIGEGFKIPSFNQSVTTAEVPGRNGSVFKSSKIGELDITIPLIIKNEWLTQDKDYDTIVNELVKFLDYGENPVQLRIKSKQWYWNAYFEGPIEILNKTEQFMLIEIKFRLCDPYKYALEGNTNTAISDSVSVVNTGTANTPVIVEARALKDSTNFFISKNNEDYFMVGKPEDADKETKDLEPYIFNDEFNVNHLRNWQYVPNDTSYGSLLDGGDAMGGRFELSSLKESIYPNKWGDNTKTGWHGAAVFKSIGKSLQDFRIRFKVSLWQLPPNKKGTGKAVAYLYDDNNRKLFSVGYVNTATTTLKPIIIVYGYNEYGEARQIYTRMVPEKLLKLKNIHAFIFFERRGQDFKITTYFYDVVKDSARKKPLYKEVKTAKDRGSIYQRPARTMHMYIGKAAKYSNHMHTRILGIKLQELLPNNNDAIGIKIREGDLVELDTGQNLVKINGDDALDLKDFGSNFFKIDRGHTELIVSPPNTFDTVVKWQDRWI